MKCGIIIAAAGQGKRMGAGVNKLFLQLEGKPILIHTLEKFLQKDWVDEIVIVVHPDEAETVKNLLLRYKIKVKQIVSGGKERQDSIHNGLNYLQSKWVMVHDGARPFIRSEILDALFMKVKQSDAAVVGVPVKDTIKVIGDDKKIRYTPDRKSLWAVQTPQAFRLSILREAYEKAEKDHFLGTDDASLVERLGIPIEIVEGDYQNIKITTLEDLLFAKAILNSLE